MNLPPAIEAQIRDIPMISEVATKLLNIVANPKHSVKNVVTVIEQDVYLTARIIRVANSAAFNRGNEITSIQRAVLHLGESFVTGIAIKTSTGEMLTGELEGYDSPEGELWRHCLQAAFAAREVAKLSKGRVMPDQAYTAGLLMDVGMAIMSGHISKHSVEIIRRLDSGEHADFTEMERDTIGVDHAQVGWELAAHWTLPESLAIGIRDHHHPSRAPEEYRPLVYALHIADLIARMAGFGVGSEALQYSLDEGYLAYYRLDSKNISELMLVVMDEFSKVERSLFS